MENLKLLRKRNELCDLVLADDTVKVAVHSCILACHSNVISKILQAQLTAEKNWSILNPLIIMLGHDELTPNKNEDIKQSAIEELVMFIYGESVVINKNQIPELQRLAILLGMDTSLEFMLSLVADPEKMGHANEITILNEENFDKTKPIKIADFCSETLSNSETTGDFIPIISNQEETIDDVIFPKSIQKSLQNSWDQNSLSPIDKQSSIDLLDASKGRATNQPSKNINKIKRKINILSKERLQKSVSQDANQLPLKSISVYGSCENDRKVHFKDSILTNYDHPTIDSHVNCSDLMSCSTSLNFNSNTDLLRHNFLDSINKECSTDIKNTNKIEYDTKKISPKTPPSKKVSFLQSHDDSCPNHSNHSVEKNLMASSNTSTPMEGLLPTSSPSLIEPNIFKDSSRDRDFFEHILSNSKEQSNTVDSLDTCSTISALEDESVVNKLTFVPQSGPSNPKKGIKRQGMICYVCNSNFNKGGDLVRHILDVEHYSQICPLCIVQLDDWTDHQAHYLQHDNPLPFFCFGCDVRFRTKTGLEQHLPKHSNSKPYTCNECGKGFKWRQAAQAHVVTHQSHRHLLCDICGFSSKYMSTFKCHIQRHNDQFFPCPHPGCNFKSYRKTHLKEHIVSHSKLRPHKCELCGLSFSLAKNLRRHLKLHAPDSFLLDCSSRSGGSCPFQTTRPDKLRFHLAKKHNISSFELKKAMPLDIALSKTKLTNEKRDLFDLESSPTNGEDSTTQMSQSDAAMIDSILLKKSIDSTVEPTSDNLNEMNTPQLISSFPLSRIVEEDPSNMEFTLSSSNTSKDDNFLHLSLEDNKGLHMPPLSSKSLMEDVDPGLSSNNLDHIISLADIPLVFEAAKSRDCLSANSENLEDPDKDYASLGEFVLQSEPSSSLRQASLQLIELPEGTIEYLPVIEQDSISLDQHSVVLSTSLSSSIQVDYLPQETESLNAKSQENLNSLTIPLIVSTENNPDKTSLSVDDDESFTSYFKT